MLFQLKTLHRAVLVVALLGAAGALLTWLCVRDPRITFLVGDRRAEWILFPSAPDIVSHPIAELDAIFRREFVLDDQPPTAQLSVRAAKRVQLKINGQPVELRAGSNWKEIINADVPGLLHAGTNTIEARVFNDNGPAALWLVLATDRLTLRSDQTWETSCTGSAWRRAALATGSKVPGKGNPSAGSEGTLTSLAVVWPVWIIFGVLSIIVWMAGQWWFNQNWPPKVIVARQWLSNEAVILLLVIAVLWAALCCNNTRLLSPVVGFDASAHIDYIGYLQAHWTLPLPKEDFEMFQPPLFYGICAVVLSTLGLSVNDETGAVVLRLLTMSFGLMHVVLVFLSLRLLFPRQFGQQKVGLLLAGFLPMLLYLSHYVTNETLAATLVSAAIYLCLRLLQAERPKITGYAGLGICLGAALLTKATGVLLVPFIVVAMASKLWLVRSASADWWRALGAMLASGLAVCGWYYLWVWLHFGTLLMGNWNAASGFQWWQDNGYHTLADMTRFGRSLTCPLFSSFSGFWDGIYSTLWGDGLCGGRQGIIYRSPWNYDLMISGHLLALVPTLIILAGAAVSVWRFIRRPSAEWFVLLGFSGTWLLALVYMNLKIPCYAQARAIYGLCTLVPLCAFGAAGWQVLTEERKWLRFALGTILLVWAMNSFAAVWIRSHSAYTHVRLGAVSYSDVGADAALPEFTRAVELEPSNVLARLFLASALNDSGRSGEAWQQAVQAVALAPTNGAGHFVLSMILGQEGQREQAIDEARRAAELGPEDLSAYRLWLKLLDGTGRDKEIINVARNGLAEFPYDAGLHYALGLALARQNDLAGATNQFVYVLLSAPNQMEIHLDQGRALLRLGDAPAGLKQFQTAVRLSPDSPVALNELAWLLATSPDAALRNGPEAIRLAEHGCTVTNRRNPRLLDTLAAAYAEAGRFPEAISVAQEALALVGTTGDETAAKRTENLLRYFQSGRPFHENPLPIP